MDGLNTICVASTSTMSLMYKLSQCDAHHRDPCEQDHPQRLTQSQRTHSRRHIQDALNPFTPCIKAAHIRSDVSSFNARSEGSLNYTKHLHTNPPTCALPAAFILFGGTHQFAVEVLLPVFSEPHIPPVVFQSP